MAEDVEAAKKYVVPKEIKEEARILIKDFLKQNNVSVSQLAEKLKKVWKRSGSRTNLLNKLARSSFSLTEFIQILSAYGYKIDIVPAKEPMEPLN